MQENISGSYASQSIPSEQPRRPQSYEQVLLNELIQAIGRIEKKLDQIESIVKARRNAGKHKQVA